MTTYTDKIEHIRRSLNRLVDDYMEGIEDAEDTVVTMNTDDSARARDFALYITTMVETEE